MARVRRNWTSKEDELLRRAVRDAESQKRPLLWRELAKSVPGRSNKDCRRRWWNSLAEGNAKGPWSEEEDEQLIASVQKHGPNWTLVAREVGSRGSDQCSSHWSHVLDPNINYCDWTKEEDGDLLHEVLTYGTRWAHIASCHSPNRTTLALKNRYSTLRLKNETKARNSKTSSDPSNDFDSPGAPTSDHQSWDEEDEGEDLDEIRCAATESWLEDLGHANKNTEGNAPQGHSAQTDAGTSKMRVTTVPIPEPPQPSLDWDYWANCKYNGLPAPHYPADNVNPQLEAVHISPGEAAAAKVDNYLQLRSPMLLSQSEHHQSSSANSSYFNPMEDDGSRRHNQAPAQTQPEILTPPYLLDDYNCRRMTSVSVSTGCLTPEATTPRLQQSQETKNGHLPSNFAKRSRVPTTARGQSMMDPQYNLWDMGGTATTPIESQSFFPSPSWPQNGSPTSPTSPWNQPSLPAPSLPPLLPTVPGNGQRVNMTRAGVTAHGGIPPDQKHRGLRVALTLDCDQDQLMTVLAQMAQLGLAPSINVVDG